MVVDRICRGRISQGQCATMKLLVLSSNSTLLDSALWRWSGESLLCQLALEAQSARLGEEEECCSFQFASCVFAGVLGNVAPARFIHHLAAAEYSWQFSKLWRTDFITGPPHLCLHRHQHQGAGPPIGLSISSTRPLL